MIRAYKNYVTACNTTLSAAPKRLFYYDYVEHIIGRSHIITVPFLTDSSAFESHQLSGVPTSVPTTSSVNKPSIYYGSTPSSRPCTSSMAEACNSYRNKPYSGLITSSVGKTSSSYGSTPSRVPDTSSGEIISGCQRISPPAVPDTSGERTVAISRSTPSAVHGTSFLQPHDNESDEQVSGGVLARFRKKKYLKPVSHNEYVQNYLEGQSSKEDEFLQMYKDLTAKQIKSIDSNTKELGKISVQFERFNDLFAKLTETVSNRNNCRKRSRASNSD